MLINASTFANNAHDNAARAFAGAVYLQDAGVTITNSTFSGNSSQTGIGALWMLSDQASRLANCTFTGNSATGGAGAIDFSGGPVFASNLTISGNTTGAWPAGIRVSDTSQVWMKNCILSDNVVTVASLENTYNGWNTSKAVSDGGGNLQWPRQRGATGIDDTLLTPAVTIADPQLSPLGANGGPTLTMMIPDGGAAQDHGTSVSAPARDQRGLTRGANPDIGAVERRLRPRRRPPAAEGCRGHRPTEEWWADTMGEAHPPTRRRAQRVDANDDRGAGGAGEKPPNEAHPPTRQRAQRADANDDRGAGGPSEEPETEAASAKEMRW